MATDKLKERFVEIEKLAKAANLDPYDVHFFEVPASLICEVASYGLPTRYSHWSFGKVYQYQRVQGEMGYSKIYELILNNNPSYAFLDNSNTDTTNLLIAAHCYLPGTYVQTTSGIKLIEDIKSTDVVYNRFGRETSVKRPTYNIYDGEVVTIQAGSYKFTQTEDHKLYAIKTDPLDRKKYRSWEKAFNVIEYKPQWVEAYNLKPGDFLVVNKPKRPIDTGDFDHRKTCSINIEIDKVLWNQKVEKTIEIPLDEDFGELIGLYLAEGYARPKGQMGLCFHANETELHARSSELISKCFNLDSRLKTSSNSAVVEFNEICIAAYLRNQLGHSCYLKHLPDEWMRLADISFLRGVLKGFLLGDGTKCQERSMGYTTTSSLLAMQIQQIGMMCGIYFGISPMNKSTELQNREVSYVGICSGIYDNKVRKLLSLPEREVSRSWSGVIESNDCFYVKINSIATEEYTGIVHCMQVASEQSFTLANGIVTHNCYGHSDFFKNNVAFKECGETNMISVAKRHADTIDQFRADYGDDEVDEWLDIALALEQHIDVYRGYKRTRYPKRHVEYEERETTPWEDIVHRDVKPVITKVMKGLYLPPHPERDILWFLSEYSNLESWQQRIFQIVRRESYYFYPQFRTKVMNEGWASYWHAELMKQYFMGSDNDYGVSIEHPLTSEEHLDFASSHEKVVQPGLKLRLKTEVDEVDPMTGRPTGRKIKQWNPQTSKYFARATKLNPYYVGFKMFRYIKKKWDEYYEQGYREDEWGTKIPVDITGDQKIREVMMEEDDVSFFRNYLTEELVEDLHLFAYGNTDDYDDNYTVQEEISKRLRDNQENHLGQLDIDRQYINNKTIAVRSKELKDIIRMLAKGKNNYGVPKLVVRRVDEAGLLRLEHLTEDDVNLDIKYAEHVIRYIYRVWNRPVELVRKDKDLTWTMHYDGMSFEINHEAPDYPECIEDRQSPSSW